MIGFSVRQGTTEAMEPLLGSTNGGNSKATFDAKDNFELATIDLNKITIPRRQDCFEFESEEKEENFHGLLWDCEIDLSDGPDFVSDVDSTYYHHKSLLGPIDLFSPLNNDELSINRKTSASPLPRHEITESKSPPRSLAFNSPSGVRLFSDCDSSSIPISGHLATFEKKTSETTREGDELIQITSHIGQLLKAIDPRIGDTAIAASPETSSPTDTLEDDSMSFSSTELDEYEFKQSPGSIISKLLSHLPNDSGKGENNILRQLLSPMKQAFVDLIMTKFGSIIEQEWAANLIGCAGETPSSSSSSGTSNSQSESSQEQIKNLKRQREDEDEPPNDNDGRNPKRPNTKFEIRTSRRSGLKFACPYRKHAPEKYGIYTHRACALSHWDTVARIKEHLYRCHRVPIQCKRCWQIFKSYEALDSHYFVIEFCEVVTGQPKEGLTADIEGRLRSRKRSSPDQSEESRWKEIYAVIFPGEPVPEPYFEPVQEMTVLSPDSRVLSDYEEYRRQELPGIMESALRDAIDNETHVLEEHIINLLWSLMRDCNEKIYSSYQSKLTSVGDKPTVIVGQGVKVRTSPSAREVPARASRSDDRTPNDILTAAYHAPAPQSGGNSMPDIQHVRNTPAPSGNPNDKTVSDSAYFGSSELGVVNVSDASQKTSPPVETFFDIADSQQFAQEGSHHVITLDGLDCDLNSPNASFDQAHIDWMLDLNSNG